MPVGIQRLHRPVRRSTVSRIDERSSNPFLRLNLVERSLDGLLTDNNLSIISTTGSDGQAGGPGERYCSPLESRMSMSPTFR